MVLSTRRGSRRAPRPRPWRTPRTWPPVPRPSLPRPPRPRPRRSLAASTAAPPARRCAPYRRGKRPPPRHRARPRPRRCFLGQRGAARRRLTWRRRLLRSAPSAMRAAVPALSRARWGSCAAAASGASVQGSAGVAAPPPARPSSPPPRSRPGAHFSGLPLGSARGPRAGAGGPGVTREPGPPRSSARAARGSGTDVAASPRRLYSPRPGEDPDSGGGGDSWNRPVPGAVPPRTVRRQLCAAATAAARPRESPGRPAQPSSGRWGAAGRGRGPTPPAAPPRHVLPLFPPRRPQLWAGGAL